MAAIAPSVNCARLSSTSVPSRSLAKVRAAASMSSKAASAEVTRGTSSRNVTPRVCSVRICSGTKGIGS